MQQTLLPWLSIVMLAMVPTAAIGGADLEAWIETTVQGQVLFVSPKAKAKAQSAQVVRYELVSRKTGTAGTSDSRQAGTKSVACCETVSLAALRLSVAPDDMYTLTLRIYFGSDLVAQDEVVYPPGRETGK